MRRSDDTVSREFVQWLASLAPEGETALIVRQKPREPVEYHADGAIKATIPSEAAAAEAARQAIRDKYAAIQSDIDAAPGVPELKLIADSLV